MSGPTPIRTRRAAEADLGSCLSLLEALNAHQGDAAGHLTREILARDCLGDDPWMPIVVAETEIAAEAPLRDEGPRAAGRRDIVGLAAWCRAYEPAFAARGAYLTALWVEPDFRRRGVARALLDAVAAEARAAGGVYVWWASKPWNAEAHAAYQRLGAIREGVAAHALVFEAFSRAADRGRLSRGSRETPESRAPSAGDRRR